MIEPQGCWQSKLGDILAVRPLNWKEIIDEDDDDENKADPGALSRGKSHPGYGNHNDNGKVEEEDMKGSDKGTQKGTGTMDGKGKAKATEDRKGKGKRKQKGNGKGNGIVTWTPAGDDIPRVIALQ